MRAIRKHSADRTVKANERMPLRFAILSRSGTGFGTGCGAADKSAIFSPQFMQNATPSGICLPHFIQNTGILPSPPHHGSGCLRYLEGFFFFFSSYILLSATVMSWKIELSFGGTVMQEPMLTLS